MLITIHNIIPDPAQRDQRAKLSATVLHRDGAACGATAWAFILLPTPDRAPLALAAPLPYGDGGDCVGPFDFWAVMGINGPLHGLDGPPKLHLVSPTGRGADLVITTEAGEPVTPWTRLHVWADYTSDYPYIQGELEQTPLEEL